MGLIERSKTRSFGFATDLPSAESAKDGGRAKYFVVDVLYFRWTFQHLTKKIPMSKSSPKERFVYLHFLTFTLQTMHILGVLRVEKSRAILN